MENRTYYLDFPFACALQGDLKPPFLALVRCFCGKIGRGSLSLGAFARNRKPWTPPKQALAPEASATLRDRLVGKLSGLASADEDVGAACARSQEHPEGCRCRRRGGGVRVADGRAWRGGRSLGPSLTALASGSRRGSCGIDRGARPRWSHGRPARQRGGRQGSAPPCGEAQAQAAAS